MEVGLYLKIQTFGSWSMSAAGTPSQREVEVWHVELHLETCTRAMLRSGFVVCTDTSKLN